MKDFDMDLKFVGGLSRKLKLLSSSLGVRDSEPVFKLFHNFASCI